MSRSPARFLTAPHGVRPRTKRPLNCAQRTSSGMKSASGLPIMAAKAGTRRDLNEQPCRGRVLGLGSWAASGRPLPPCLLAALPPPPLALLVAFVEQLAFFLFLEGFSQGCLRIAQREFETGDRALEFFPPLHGGLGISRIRKMRGIV